MTAKHKGKVASKKTAKSAPPKSKPARAPSPHPEDVHAAIGVVLSVEEGPWEKSAFRSRVADNLAGKVETRMYLAGLAIAVDAKDIEYDGATIRKPASVLAASPLGLAVARVLGEAHEPLSAEDLHRRVLSAGQRPSPERLLATVEAMAPQYVTARGEGKRRRYATAGVESGGEGAEETAAAEEKPAPVLPPPAPLPTVAELAATAKRRLARLKEDVTAERRAALEVERAETEKKIDALMAEAKRMTKSCKLITKALRKGFSVRVAEVVTVPDYAGDRLVTLEPLTLGEGSFPDSMLYREVKSKPLPPKYRQATLPGMTAAGRAS